MSDLTFMCQTMSKRGIGPWKPLPAGWGLSRLGMDTSLTAAILLAGL